MVTLSEIEINNLRHYQQCINEILDKCNPVTIETKYRKKPAKYTAADIRAQNIAEIKKLLSPNHLTFFGL